VPRTPHHPSWPRTPGHAHFPNRQLAPRQTTMAGRGPREGAALLGTSSSQDLVVIDQRDTSTARRGQSARGAREQGRPDTALIASPAGSDAIHRMDCLESAATTWVATPYVSGRLRATDTPRCYAAQKHARRHPRRDA